MIPPTATVRDLSLAPNEAHRLVAVQAEQQAPAQRILAPLRLARELALHLARAARAPAIPSPRTRWTDAACAAQPRAADAAAPEGAHAAGVALERKPASLPGPQSPDRNLSLTSVEFPAYKRVPVSGWAALEMAAHPERTL
jgi:hypothetical protein